VVVLSLLPPVSIIWKPRVNHKGLLSYSKRTMSPQLWVFFIHAQIFRLLLKISVEETNLMSI